jgi:FkbM family methyltransferase
MRTAIGREQHHQIAGHSVVLPPQHDLPFYQRRDPTYDRYAGGILADLASTVDRMLVIDLGANVGDTAVECLGAAPNIDVIAVEGAAAFLPYLYRNVESFGQRCRVKAAFIGPVPGITERGFNTGHTTANFARAGGSGEQVDNWISPNELVAEAAGYDLVVWKSDVDGLDIHLLVEHWALIEGGCDVLWFEYAPADTLGSPDDAQRLAALIGASGRAVDVYENLGRLMVRLKAGEAAQQGLDSVTAWLLEQRKGHVAVPYVDIWAFAPAVTQRMTQ